MSLLLLAHQAAFIHPSSPKSRQSMEGVIFAIALGLLLTASQQLAANETQAAGVAIVPNAQNRPQPTNGDGRGDEPAIRATANLVSLFSTDDYPREAIRNGEQGTVAVTVTVNADGKVGDCVINQSSGSPSLDVQTCRIIWTRASFTPARDARGKSVQDTYKQRIHWELPAPDPAEVSEQFARRIITVDAQKAIVDCRFEASPDWELDDPNCSKALEHLRKFVSTAPDWVEFAGNELVLETQHRVGEPQGGTELGERPGEIRLALVRLYLTIDAGGKVKSCSRDSWGASRPPAGGANCEFVDARWRFEGLPAHETNRNDRQLTIVEAMFLRKLATPPQP